MPNAYEDASREDRAASEQIDRLTGLIFEQEQRFEQMQEGMLKKFGDIMENVARRSQESMDAQLQDAMSKIEQRAQDINRMPNQAGQPAQQQAPNAQPVYQSQLPPAVISQVSSATLGYQQAFVFLQSVMDHAGLSEKIDISPDNLLILYGKAAGILK